MSRIEPRPAIKAGTLFMLSSGEYSDYNIAGVFVARIEITWMMLLEIQKEINTEKDTEEEKGEYYSTGDLKEKLITELIKRELVIDANCRAFHLGSYGELDLTEEPA